MKVLENIINNHITQLEDKKTPREYKILLYNYCIKFMRVASHYDKHVWAGEMMMRLYGVASELDKVDSKWREIIYRFK